MLESYWVLRSIAGQTFTFYVHCAGPTLMFHFLSHYLQWKLPENQNQSMANLMRVPTQPEQRPRLMLIQRINSQELIPDCKDSSESWMFEITIHTRGIFCQINSFLPDTLPKDWHEERITITFDGGLLLDALSDRIVDNCNIIYDTVQIIFFSKIMGVITSLPSATKWYYIPTFPDLMPKRSETIGTLCVHDKGITIPTTVWFLNFSKSFFHQKVLCNYLCL